MTRITFGCLLFFALMFVAHAALDKSKVKKLQTKLRNAKIFPDVVDEFEPETELKVTFHEDRIIDMGTQATPEEVANRPHIWFRNTSTTAQYTLALFDADAEVPLVKHWISINVDGLKPATDFKDNTTLHQYVPYHGPTPPADGKKHRYVFMLYEQPEISQVMKPALEDPHAHRAFFNIRNFATQNNLRPVGITYMLIEHQEGFDGEFRRNNAEFFSTALPYSVQAAIDRSASSARAASSGAASANVYSVRSASHAAASVSAIA